MDIRLEIQKTNVGIKISILEILCVPISRQNGHFLVFGRSFPKNWLWAQNFRNLSPNSESVHPRFYGCQFSVKTDNFELFGLNLEKLPNHIRYFGANNVEGIAESWVEVQMSWVEVGRTGWNWMKVDGAGWRWVQGLAIPILFQQLKFC